MAVKITTISVSPQSAEALRELRDEQGLPSMDAALQRLVKKEQG